MALDQVQRIRTGETGEDALQETDMKKLFYKFGMAGLLSLLLLGFSQIGISNEIFDLSKDTIMLAEVTE